MSETGQAASSKDKQLDVRLMTPEQRAMAAMILADATPERTQDAAGHAGQNRADADGSDQQKRKSVRFQKRRPVRLHAVISPGS